MFRFAAESLPFHDYSLEETLSALRTLGFRSVNLWSSAAPLAHHVGPGDDVVGVLELLHRFDMRTCGLTMYGKSQTEILDRIDLAQELGIDTVIFDCEANYSDFVGSFLPPILDRAAKAGVRVAIENHLTVPFSADFERGVGEDERWAEGVDSLAQIKRLVTDLDHPNLGICLAPPHLWVMGESITEAIHFLAERKKLFYYYVWDIDRAYRRGHDGLDFGPGEHQLPRASGTLDHRVPLAALKQVGYQGVVSLKCHGTAGWSMDHLMQQLGDSDVYVRNCLASL
jgi:sugar phosphate isomerase/epimerase